MLFRITWDVGYGEMEDFIECGSEEEANLRAYQCALEDIESQMSYGAEEWPYEEED